MMIRNNKIFTVGEVNEWMDCGNPKVTVETNQKMLDYRKYYEAEVALIEQELKHKKLGDKLDNMTTKKNKPGGETDEEVKENQEIHWDHRNFDPKTIQGGLQNCS